MNEMKINSYLRVLRRSFDITYRDIEAIIADFHAEMARGLKGEGGSLKMLPAFVDVARGSESGTFIALDLGGTNFRVLQVSLNGKGRAKVEHTEKFVIPKSVMRGTGAGLFNFIARSIQRFLIGHVDPKGKRRLGFAFSFPIRQEHIASGILINWTKGFTATGVVGGDVVKLLGRSLEDYGIRNVEITALANDTVGTLAAKSYEDPTCDIGVIFGTGTNACYRERLANIKKIGPRACGGSKRMIINIEWGNFNGFMTSEFDRMLDESSNNPGKQIMEKMISGMYLGELVRLVISDMIRKKLIFKGRKAGFFRDGFTTEHMSQIEDDRSRGMKMAGRYLETIGVKKANADDLRVLKRVCRVVSRRAARISAASLAAVVTWMDPGVRRRHTVGIDGTLYERYPGFRRTIRSVLGGLFGERKKNIRLVHAKDGSGIGVAVVAAVAARNAGQN